MDIPQEVNVPWLVSAVIVDLEKFTLHQATAIEKHNWRCQTLKLLIQTETQILEAITETTQIEELKLTIFFFSGSVQTLLLELR